MLFELKVEEKLPELLYDTEHIDVVSEFLYSSIDCEVFNIGESVYRLSRKSMFKPLQKKKAHNPCIVLKYIDEIDNHNYTYYQKKEKWLSIKDILSKQLTDDEYVTDVIYPRLCEVYEYDNVMSGGISFNEFERKYNLLFGLLEDVMSKEEIYDKHKDLFLYYPDPSYGEKDGVTIEEVVEPKPFQEPPKPEEPIIQEPIIQEPIIQEPIQPKPQEPTPIEESMPIIVKRDPEVIEKNDDTCSNCGLCSYHLTTNTFLHSHDDHRKIKCIRICYNCLEHHNLDDF